MRNPATKKKRFWIAMVIILSVLLLFRLFLPYIVLRYVNNKLSNLEQYTGHVEDIDIALIRGAYIINDMRIEKIDDKKGNKKDTIPFFTTPKMDLSVEWRALFKGRVVGEIYVEDPRLNFVKGKHKDEDIKADTADFSQLIKDLMPLKVNHFEIHRGQIHYIDKNTSPIIDIALKDVMVKANNISNVNDSAKLLPAHLVASGNAYNGKFNMNVNFDVLKKAPTFDLNARLQNLDLVKMNDFLKAYGNFEVKEGRFGLYTEFAAKNGEFGGYVKPLIKDMKVEIWKKDQDLQQRIWNIIVANVSKLLENKNTDQLATKVSINGRFDDPNINLWKAVSYLLRNAFVQALKPSIDNSININKMEEDSKKTFLEKIFGNTKKSDKK